VKEEEPSTRA